jgi:hypothetical protein
MTKELSRRTVLKGSALAALTSLFGFNVAAYAQDGDDDTQTIINLAATAELFATTHYLAGINGAEAMGLDPVQVDYLKTGFLAEQDHLDLLRSLGAEPVVTEFYVPEGLFEDKALFSEITEVAETIFVAAYLAATRIFTAAGAPQFAVTTAQIAAVEAEHRALVRQIGGRLANNISYGQYQFDNVSDAVPLLQPFLDGSGEGFVGPVSPPAEDDIAAIRAEAESLGYVNSVPYAAIAAESSGSGSSSSACSVTAGDQNVNIRGGAGTEFVVRGKLAPGQSAEVSGYRVGTDGQRWWQLADGGWVRADTVTTVNDCSGVAAV